MSTTTAIKPLCDFCDTRHLSREVCPVDEHEARVCTCGHPDCGAC